jgi:hypothetical protein
MHLGESASIIAFTTHSILNASKRKESAFYSLVQRCALKSVSQADKVKLHKVVISPVDDVVTDLAEYPDIWGKSIFEPTAHLPKTRSVPMLLRIRLRRRPLTVTCLLVLGTTTVSPRGPVTVKVSLKLADGPLPTKIPPNPPNR